MCIRDRYRDTPVNGDLRKASNILTEFEGLKSTQRQNLIAAYITRLFLKGTDTYGGMFEKCNYQADMCIAFLPSRRYTEEDDSSGGKHEKDI